jgi:hypothetical protein
MILHGTYTFGTKRVACRNGYCTTCRTARFAEGFRSWRVLHVFFLPILPIGTVTRWYCTEHGHQLDARRPNRPWILYAGIFGGVLMSFIGIMLLFEPGEQGGAVMIPAGIVFSLGLFYLLKRQNYRNYAAAQQSVPPLSSEHCPYCKAPVLNGTPPRCHTCKVDILGA